MSTISLIENQPPCPDDKLFSIQADKIINIFKNIQRSLTTKFKKSANKYGFTVPQLSVIFHLYKMPYVTLNELSECMMLTKSTVSGIIDRLEKQGIVIREIPEDNRRIVRLSLSNDFKEKHDISSMKKEFISDCILDIIKDMGPVETDNFISSLEHFNSLIKK
ncbi:MAG: MarR family winged helix-turn-helix transcriptional regulator [Clostridium sp.]|uniref:MarR family winged helix-turn-helix transcriptional regulator n=1 Tax=Clostridium sp. TaxID=1506 RepID=UPI0025BD2470|nr:MarR family winged helix-turn-helix transcriptional regulator [Clostridium sp.]MCH3965147.1 MarR family winged helix-turn-helix transcriptional regulator [Clostridium sp.]MCI1714368.1 MarR family winged helix-turn-helix transcriptional regulator [Clostridium sp.]MCI1798630.1 MarR family winged helix-turn-helix transcriptional regulator [Clostridium sp.]MCI1812639.1 MarR family winged helix-turn-helix transcriptional regulator [Clostridium sp.]MCI1869439.1 MarR family winged helix-turn-helix